MKLIDAWLPDVDSGTIVGLLFFLVFFTLFAVNIKHLLDKWRHDQPLVVLDFTSFIGGVVLSAVTGYSLCAGLRHDHLLRVGPHRFTVAVVTRTYWSRTGRRFAFAYRVGPYQGSDSQTCPPAGCPPIGSRRYVRFAAEAPDVSELTRWDVPDSLQTVPPLGWAELP
jgi:hypothetical protein